ncbi:MAG TPA: MlaD family protein [Mycobacterium sp.]|nr:MlaD family protein [Mycobacterium sp.]
MYLDRRTKIQLAICSIVSLVAGAVMIFGYIRLPALLFGVGQYTVSVQLPSTGGLYEGGNVTYRGTEVGRVSQIRLSDTGVVATLSLRSDIPIPSDLDARVNSVSSIGEQFMALTPRDGTSRPLKNGDVIARNRASVPPDINALVAATNRGLQAIPRDNLKTVVDEGYVAVGGLGAEISRLVRGSTTLAIDAREHLDSLTTLIDRSQPVLDSQAQTADAIHAWAAHLATVTQQLQSHDDSVTGLIQRGAPAAAETRQLFERLRPTLPILLANLVTVGEVAVAYQPNIEQLLVLVPHVVEEYQGGIISNVDTKQDYKGAFLDFNLNVNLPPPCTTGYLPAQQRRPASLEDYPDLPAGDLYCRVPQDSPLVAVRGARNAPCATVPGKRAPTAQMCDSDEQYVPLNEGTNWKGDPNATLSGQDIPQLPPGSAPAPVAPPAPAPPPLAVVEYDPATGTYLGPDGQVYTQANLGQTATEHTWQNMLVPPAAN